MAIVNQSPLRWIDCGIQPVKAPSNYVRTDGYNFEVGNTAHDIALAYAGTGLPDLDLHAQFYGYVAVPVILNESLAYWQISRVGSEPSEEAKAWLTRQGWGGIWPSFSPGDYLDGDSSRPQQINGLYAISFYGATGARQARVGLSCTVYDTRNVLLADSQGRVILNDSGAAERLVFRTCRTVLILPVPPQFSIVPITDDSGAVLSDASVDLDPYWSSISNKSGNIAYGMGEQFYRVDPSVSPWTYYSSGTAPKVIDDYGNLSFIFFASISDSAYSGPTSIEKGQPGYLHILHPRYESSSLSGKDAFSHLFKTAGIPHEAKDITVSGGIVTAPIYAGYRSDGEAQSRVIDLLGADESALLDRAAEVLTGTPILNPDNHGGNSITDISADTLNRCGYNYVMPDGRYIYSPNFPFDGRLYTFADGSPGSQLDTDSAMELSSIDPGYLQPLRIPIAFLGLDQSGYYNTSDTTYSISADAFLVPAFNAKLTSRQAGSRKLRITLDVSHTFGYLVLSIDGKDLTFPELPDGGYQGVAFPSGPRTRDFSPSDLGAAENTEREVTVSVRALVKDSYAAGQESVKVTISFVSLGVDGNPI